jgi:hypothetical protein
VLKNKNVEVYISYRNITHYRKLGYNPILNESLLIKTTHLPSNSHFIIDVICQICSKESSLRYHKYIENKNRHGFYGCKSCSRQKAALTSLSKWGVDNYSKTDEFKYRVEETNLSKYGYKTNLISPEYKANIKSILKDKYGTENFYQINRNKTDKVSKNKFLLNDNINELVDSFEISESLYKKGIMSDDYLLYRNEVRRLTKSNLKKLYKIWNGYDYYDSEYILENYKLYHNDPGYPTIDHKISVYYGFINNIPPEEISDINNLCITKRFINSKKRDLIESEFKL